MDTQILYSKIASVPAPIRTWLGSDAVLDIIENAPEAYTLPESSSRTIANLLQRIQIKDLGPDYFSGELANELQLDKDKAVHITEEIKKHIFSIRRKDFADYGINIDLLDKFQMPTMKAPAATGGPKMISDSDVGAIPPSAPHNISPVPAAPKSQSPSSVPFSVSVVPTRPIQQVPPMPKPASSSVTIPAKPSAMTDVGWSKTQASGPVVKLDVSNVPPQAPVRSAALTPASIAPVIRPTGSATMGEFERMSMMKTAPPTPGATPTAPAPTPAPIIIHQDDSFHAAEKNAGFMIPKSTASAEIPLSSQKPVPGLARPAVLELGSSAGTNSAPKPVASGAAPGQMVHYTDYKPPLSSIPTANSGPRNLSEITAAPAVPKPPTPPQPPRPPQPPQTSNQNPPQGGKVIVKNFP